MDIPKGVRILALLASYRRPMRYSIGRAVTHITEISQSSLAHLARKSELSTILASWTFNTKRAQLDAFWLAKTHVLLYKESGRKRGSDVGTDTVPDNWVFAIALPIYFLVLLATAHLWNLVIDPWCAWATRRLEEAMSSEEIGDKGARARKSSVLGGHSRTVSVTDKV